MTLQVNIVSKCLSLQSPELQKHGKTPRLKELSDLLNLSQGHFPRMENIAAFKPVSTSPPRCTCGFPERSSYCQSPSSQVELLTCYQAFCVQECPYRSSTPPYAPLLLAAHRRASLFLDGLEDDGTPFDSQQLTTRLSDVMINLYIGLNFFFISFCYNREIVELYSGVLPELHVQSECRCPPTHPRVHPLIERYCIPNAVEDTTNDRVLRLNLNAHPLSYINDQDMGTTWVSKIMTTQELDDGVTITVDLANGQYQVMETEINTTTEQPWLDWQYMARNCSVFEMENNGPLLRPDSVNCLQLPSDMPFSGGNITFSLLTTHPPLRPGYNDFYNTPVLQEMVQSAQVRIHMSGQYYTRAVGCNHFPQCESCAPLYNDKPFRSGDQLQPMNCRPCQCHGHSLSCHYDVLADDHPDEHYQGGGGVCDNCMHNTTGKNCEQCISGFFRLEDSDPTSVDVCQPCNCYTAGTVNGSMDCAQIGGQCHCKAAVTGRECADCLPGWFDLTASNPNGCISCNCSDMGIMRTSTGAVPSCNHYTGQCRCKPHVTGLSCDHCEFGYWNLSHPDGCIPCGCDPLGSLSPFCEPEGGQCECKPGVGGLRCDSCGRGLFGLRLEGSCAPCNCSQEGTVPGTDCDSYTGQCVCKEHVEGRRCDSCSHGFHTLEQRNSLGCLPCVCDTSGTVPGVVCDMQTGQCPCKDGVEGVQCTNCAHNYYNRTLNLETLLLCHPCACDPVGSTNGLCHPDTGICECKLLVTGDKCDLCQLGASHLDPDNHFGCTKAPSQQPAPVGVALSYSSIRLSWYPPDSPNSHRLNYTLIRDGQSVHTIQSRYPFSRESFEDIGLSPFTNYSYWLITANVAGMTISASASYQTLGAPPEADQLHLNLVGRPGATSASFNWSTPRNDTGPACSSGGCSSSPPLSLLTASAPPQNQPPPIVTAMGPHTLHASWEPPSQPNGVITMYEVFLRGPVESQNLSSLGFEKRVFLSSGWLNQSVSSVSNLANRSTVSLPETSTDITGLQAYSTYQMRVVSTNIAGSSTSGWTTARTMEGVPEFMAPPEVSALSSTSLKVTWSTAEDHGVIVLHRVGPSSQPIFIVKGLKPYYVYNFTVTLCTKTGCVTSLPSTGWTLPAGRIYTHRKTSPTNKSMPLWLHQKKIYPKVLQFFSYNQHYSAE
uniref:Usher syndrome 2A (autosomal recessive, mild) n=1 Tax=Amphilophus citrinellus TaxID=61819 RepID=A0A3Q0RBB8_AMPCI